MGIVCLVFGLLLLIGGIVLSVYVNRKHDKETTRYEKKELLRLLIGLVGVAVGSLLTQAGINILAYANMGGGYIAMSLIGASLFGAAFYCLWTGFAIRYYAPKTEDGQRKYATLALFISIPVALGAFLLLGEGVAPYLTYPLVSGFEINNGFHWVSAATGFSGFHVAWYGVIIVGGAIVCYYISDHRFYQKYGKHGILDTCFLVCFPSGILAARIWYVVGNWNVVDEAGRSFANGGLNPIAIWDGGLTILGGAIGGIIGGAIYMLLARKWVDIRFPLDVVVPTILIGQAIGRWGNFFNLEVYGEAVSQANWMWLPTWLRNQMAWGAGDGKMYVPLFLIESLLNIAGYFIIAWGVPAIWRKNRPMGVLAGFYLLWYGVVRIVMEPIRDPDFNMGTNGMWSVWNALAYIILGVVMIVALILLEKLVLKGRPLARGSAEEYLAKQEAKKKAKEPAPLESKKNVDKKEVERSVKEAPTFVIEEKKDGEEN